MSRRPTDGDLALNCQSPHDSCADRTVSASKVAMSNPGATRLRQLALVVSDLAAAERILVRIFSQRYHAHKKADKTAEYSPGD